MGVFGLVSRGVERLRAVGPRKFGEFLTEKYLQPFNEDILQGSRSRDYVIGKTFKLSVPVFSIDEGARLFADLRAFEASGRHDLEVRIVSTVPLENPGFSFDVQITQVETPRLVLSLVLWFGHVFLPTYLDPQRRSELETTLRKLGVDAFHDAGAVSAAYDTRRIITLHGKGRHTRFLYNNLRTNIDGAHYGFREPIDLDIVKELPGKFDYISRHCDVNYIPIRDLNRYPGRVSRQYVVGQMYKDKFFGTGSVLDVGCDIRGISEHVTGKYVGVDIQGLGDLLIDLDKEDLPFEPRSFDTVLCFEVLEHLNKIHQSLDNMLEISGKYFIGSLFVESGVWGGKSISRYGDPYGNMYLPIAPIFDRHEWIFSASDALDFIYYRARRSGFRLVRLDVFYDDARPMIAQLARLQRAMQRGDVAFLSKHVMMFGFVLERVSAGSD